VLFFTLLGFWLRLLRLDFQPLWGDEGWSFYFAVQPVGALIALTAIDIHPPLYYLLLKMWLTLTSSGPEVARFMSVISGTLLIPVIAVLGRRLFDWRVGTVSALVTAASPLAVYYSQEVRMYGLVTLLGLLSTYCYARWRAGWGFRLGYVLCSAAALYTMYYAAFLLLAHAIHALFISRRHIKQSMALFVAVGLLYLPWVIYAAPRLVTYVANKRDVEGYASLGPVRFLWSHLAAFSVGHLWDAWWFLSVVAIVIAGGLVMAGTVYTWRNPPARILFLYLALPMVTGFLVNLVYPFTPAYFERTLLLVAPAYWLLLTAGGVWLWTRQRLVTGILVTVFGVIMVGNLYLFFVTPRYSDEDYRPLLRQVAARATIEDTLLASYQWQLGFYHAYLPHPRPRLFAVPGWGAGWSAEAGHAARRDQDLSAILSTSPRLWFPAYQASGHIWEDETETAIAGLGYPAILQWFGPQTKLTLTGAEQSPEVPAATATFGNLVELTQATVGGTEYQAGRDIIPVALTWHRISPTSAGDDTVHVSLRLVDSEGHTWSSRDELSYPGVASLNTLSVSETLTERLGFLTPAGTPPGKYQLLLSVRHSQDGRPLDLLSDSGQPLGAELLLAEVTLLPPRPPVGVAALPIQHPVEARFDRMLQLEGYSLGSETIMTGEQLPLTLFWQARGASPDVEAVAVELQDMSGKVVVTEIKPFSISSMAWQSGDLLRQPFMFTLPPTLSPGQYLLTVAVITPEGNRLAVNGTDRYSLQQITSIDRPRKFEPPQIQDSLAVNFGDTARLLGVDIPQHPVSAGSGVSLTLYWQAIATAGQNRKVFLHLTDDQGNIIAQKDQVPGNGKFPLTGWVPGEYITDEYILSLPPDTPTGTYLLRIGLYNTNDGSRLPVIVDGQATANHTTLDSWPIFVE
jgi:4-amino-4-deoxy-L-arabinose transferase-like glycosyltransferase